MSDAGRDLIDADIENEAQHVSVGKDMPTAASGGSAVNIRFGDDDRPRSKKIWTMDDLYLELSRQIENANEKINHMSLAIARLEIEVSQLHREVSEQPASSIAYATLAGVILLAVIGAIAVWVLSNGG